MLFTIKDLENLSGIKAHTLRIWEQRYSFLKPQRTDTNIRYYTNEELQTILTIALLNKHGYKISHIDKMTPEKMAENVLSLTDAEAREHVVINGLLHSMTEYDIESFEKSINQYIEQAGFEKTILRILFPFLEKVGILWVTNHVNPAQEHLVSNIIRQKLITGIDAIPTNYNSSLKVCLFLPEGEYHELSLLLVNYLLKKKGIMTIYLGSHTPFKELKLVAQHHKPNYLYTHITSSAQPTNFDKFISSLKEIEGGLPTIISGRFTDRYQKNIPKNIFVKQTLAEVRDFIDQLS
ncbi:MerR family transcriptional regulator [soil metagenome]